MAEALRNILEVACSNFRVQFICLRNLIRLIKYCIFPLKFNYERFMILLINVIFFCCLLQAIMYILCFRMRSMLGIPRTESQLSRLPMRAILKHSLNPLKVKSLSPVCNLLLYF